MYMYMYTCTFIHVRCDVATVYGGISSSCKIIIMGWSTFYGLVQVGTCRYMCYKMCCIQVQALLSRVGADYKDMDYDYDYTMITETDYDYKLRSINADYDYDYKTMITIMVTITYIFFSWKQEMNNNY